MKKKNTESTADVHPKIGKTIISDVLYNVCKHIIFHLQIGLIINPISCYVPCVIPPYEMYNP